MVEPSRISSEASSITRVDRVVEGKSVLKARAAAAADRYAQHQAVALLLRHHPGNAFDGAVAQFDPRSARQFSHTRSRQIVTCST
jgi:hypothetical protein